MNPDPKIDLAGAPVVKIGGAEYFVPMLALRQSRIVVPGLLRLLPILDGIQQRIADGDVGAAAAIKVEDFDLIIDVVRTGLTRAYPTLTVDDFLDLGATFSELTAALGVIARQTGLFAQTKTSAGEAQGEATPPTLT